MTQLLELARTGDARARDNLLQTIYAELRGLARGHFAAERPGHTLQPTALVNEVYLKLLQGEELPGTNRAQLLAFVSKAMRHILIDHARTRDRLKRGGGRERLPLAENVEKVGGADIDLIALDEALKALAELDERKSRVVELRFFGGMRVEQVAEVLGISVATVKRDWEVARMWLYRELRKGDTVVK